MPGYARAAALEVLGKDIIRDFYPELSELSIAFMFRAESELLNGRIVAGMTTRVPDRDHALHGHDFLVVLAADIYDDLDPVHQIALLDHFIGYCGIREENGKAAKDPATGRFRTFKRKPDVEEFSGVVQRHGAHTSELQTFLIAFAERRIQAREDAKEEAKRKKGGGAPADPDAGIIGEVLDDSGSTD